MPYIPQDQRPPLKHFIDQLVELLAAAPEDNIDGQLNFVISSMCARYGDKVGWRYRKIARLIAALECAKLELYRRKASGYEDAAALKNGDIW